MLSESSAVPLMLRTRLHECRRDNESHDHRSQDQERVKEHGEHLAAPGADNRITIVLRLKSSPFGPRG